MGKILGFLGFLIGIVLLIGIALYFVWGKRAGLRGEGGARQIGEEIEKNLPVSNDLAAAKVGIEKSKEELAEDALTLVQTKRLVEEIRARILHTKRQIENDKSALREASMWLETDRDFMVDAYGEKHSRLTVKVDAEKKLSRLRANQDLLTQLENSLDQLQTGLEKGRSNIERKKLELITQRLTLVQLDVRNRNAEYVREIHFRTNRFSGPSRSNLEATGHLLKKCEDKIVMKEEANRIEQELNFNSQQAADIVRYKKNKSTADLNTRIQEALKGR